MSLMGIAEIAALGGVAKPTAVAWTRSPGFPTPLSVLAAGPVFDSDQVRDWLAQNKRAGLGGGTVVNAHLASLFAGADLSFPASPRHLIAVVGGSGGSYLAVRLAQVLSTLTCEAGQVGAGPGAACALLLEAPNTMIVPPSAQFEPKVRATRNLIDLAVPQFPSAHLAFQERFPTALTPFPGVDAVALLYDSDRPYDRHEQTRLQQAFAWSLHYATDQYPWTIVPVQPRWDRSSEQTLAVERADLLVVEVDDTQPGQVFAEEVVRLATKRALRPLLVYTGLRDDYQWTPSAHPSVTLDTSCERGDAPVFPDFSATVVHAYLPLVQAICEALDVPAAVLDPTGVR